MKIGSTTAVQQPPAAGPLARYRDVEAAIDSLVEEHIVRGRFMQALHGGEFTLQQIGEFALQYGYYSRHFPLVLGAAIAAMEPDDAWWVPIVDNLWDEGGRGNPEFYHSRLFSSFLQSACPEVAAHPERARTHPVSPAVRLAVDTFLCFLRQASPLEAMAAIGFGSEFFAGKVMGLIGEGLQHPAYNAARKLNVRFWLIHAVDHEPRHYTLCKEILRQFAKPEELKTIYRSGATIALSEARMYEELYQHLMAMK